MKCEVATAKERIGLEKRIYRLLGQYEFPYTRPPLDQRKMYISGMVVCLNNDGFEVWIGTPDCWETHMKNAEFRKICFWYLRQWAFTDWFGLRSFLWYKLLHRQVKRNSRFP